MTMHYTHLGNADLLRSADSLPDLPTEMTSDEVPKTNRKAKGIRVSSGKKPDQTKRERAELLALFETLSPDQIREILNHYRRV